VFEAILNSLDQQACLIDSRGKIIWVNAAWKAFAAENGGTPETAWRKANYHEVCTAAAQMGDHHGEVVSAGIRSVMDGSLPVFTHEYPCHSATEQRWFMFSLRPLHWEGETNYISTHLNITARKLAEMHQAETNALYEESQRLGAIGSFRLSGSGDTPAAAHWSREMFALFGLPHADVTPDWPALRDLIHPRDVASVENARAEALERDEPYSVEFRVMLPDGEERYLAEKGCPVTNGHRQLVGTTRDMTSERLLQQERADYASMVIHELRTPLTSIKGSLRMLVSGSLGALSAEAGKVFGIIERNANRLSTLLSDLLDLDKLTSGKMDYEMAPVDLSALLDECSQLDAGYASELGISFDVARADGPVWVRGDRNRLGQVVANLMSNAAKYSPKGGRVDLAVGQVAQGTARLTVTDKGEGIPADLQSRIFRRFAQIRRPGAAEVAGTGLGLAICKLIVEEHGGAIGFESTLGVGTRFYVDLPILGDAT
jgi:signal transduction histidine kinase